MPEQSDDIKPVPDPTSLTTDQLRREIAMLRELFETQLQGLARINQERIELIERQIEQNGIHVVGEIAGMRRLYDSILDERDRRHTERFEAQQMAVEAAFSASEKAVSAALDSRERAVSAAMESSEKAITKAEVSIEKRADSTYVALTELQKMLADLIPRNEASARWDNNERRITELATRVERIEASKQGGQEAVGEKRQNNAALYASIGFVVTIVGLVLTLAATGVFNNTP